jgi:hypothetical protein
MWISLKQFDGGVGGRSDGIPAVVLKQLLRHEIDHRAENHEYEQRHHSTHGHQS